jgi:hypothetical protein
METEKVSGFFFGPNWPGRRDPTWVPGLISGGLPAGDDNLMFPHTRPLPRPRDEALGAWQGGSRERCGGRKRCQGRKRCKD